MTNQVYGQGHGYFDLAASDALTDTPTPTTREQDRFAVMDDRAGELKAISQRLASVAGETPNSLVVHGDSLEQITRMPDQSVSLILCDPPYHSTKKENINGDRSFDEDEDFLAWMDSYAVQWERLLKLSGTIYLFCSSEMAARLEVTMAKHFRPIGHIVWTKPNEPGYDGWKGKMRKESLRRWYPHSERILMFEHGTYGSSEAYRRSPVGEYLLACRKQTGMSMVELTEIIGEYGKINRGGAVANWEAGRNLPSRDQFSKLVVALEATGKVGRMLDYNDLIRPMQVHKDLQFTDVWNFQSVRPFPDKHPAEKPQDMLMHMIQASTYPGDIVLDCFAGSGSSGVSAIRLGRRAVCIEIEDRWVRRAVREIAEARQEPEHNTPARA